METATMAQHPETSQLFGKGAAAEGDAAAAHAVDVEGVASQLQAVTIDGNGEDNKNQIIGGGGRGGGEGGERREEEEEGNRRGIIGTSSNSGVFGSGSSSISSSSSSSNMISSNIRGGGIISGEKGGGKGGKEEEEERKGHYGIIGDTKRGGIGGTGIGTGGEDENEILALLTKEQRTTIETLSHLQKKHDKLEHQYENELIALKMKYEALYEPLYNQRKLCLLKKDPSNPSANDKGTPAVPRFWLDCMKRNSTIADLIEEHDEPILEYLQNISCEYFTPEEQRQMEREQEEEQQQRAAIEGHAAASTVGGEKQKKKENEYPESFRLIFDFSPNPYFSPTRLVKAYHLTTVRSNNTEGNKTSTTGKSTTGEKRDGEEEEDDDDGITAGAELTSTRSTEIHWEPGKDVTKKVVTRKQRNKKTRQTRVVQEVVDNESFFNFFTDHDIPTDEKLEAMTDKQVGELQMVVEADYDIGVIIRDRIIPQAVKWFLGEADDDDQMEDEIDDDDEDADSDDLSESDEEDEHAPARGRGKAGWGGSRGKGGQNW